MTGEGNRVAETIGGVTMKYLVDTQNPTGYAQVVDGPPYLPNIRNSNSVAVGIFSALSH